MAHVGSIRINLLKWLIAPLLAINLIGAALTYRLAWVPAQMAFDQSLADAAWALVPRLRDNDGAILVDLPQQAEQVLRLDHVDEIYFIVRDQSGQVVAGDKDFPSLPAPAELNDPVAYSGMMRGEAIRMIVLKARVGTQVVSISVSETLRKRSLIRTEIFAGLVVLEGLLTAISIALVWLAVTRGLLPLKKMQADLDARSHDTLAPVSDVHLPRELRPLVDAINTLLGKVQAGAAAQQAFLANVAHQLRTPLAALQMQLEWLQQRHPEGHETAHSATLMLSATARMIRHTNQLLALARAEPSRLEKDRFEEVDLCRLIEDTVQVFVEQAVRKQIDLGFDLQPAPLHADPFLLRDLIDNLIDNAIRYSPPGSTVTVSCRREDALVLLLVEDSGPGIAEARRELIFNRFYRLDDTVAGSGLGLAIVRDIVLAHDAEMQLSTGPGGKGTTFSVRFAAG
ncbi:sensor histidine kinase [Actimicrobium sp. CCC2.4]|uniref:sensor histidine kinase n=1 Tax=Actimicrobium sp. CCC2.4 TaxID=3048606 RepID=UPI002AC9EBC8|nr:sensor histidine kinase [Actimicrobium sp. CCC2.4]MEB0136355.1 sensor histidine kinase [Actimicrobium sp. CCC2.4]WPX34193.1 sensor histidine kinase [Actimicrobium sp. CCC2.4]